MVESSVFGVEVSERGILARTADFGGFSRAIARVAQASGVSLWEIVPTDESLESVFSYLVQR
jgi:ABC-2 type transport system ATP-binding protein